VCTLWIGRSCLGAPRRAWDVLSVKRVLKHECELTLVSTPQQSNSWSSTSSYSEYMQSYFTSEPVLEESPTTPHPSRLFCTRMIQIRAGFVPGKALVTEQSWGCSSTRHRMCCGVSERLGAPPCVALHGERMEDLHYHAGSLIAALPLALGCALAASRFDSAPYLPRNTTFSRSSHAFKCAYTPNPQPHIPNPKPQPKL